MPNSPGRPRVAVAMADEKQHRRLIAEATNRVISGQTDNTVYLSLAASATTTTLTDSRISAWTCIVLMPQTADAAAAWPGIWITCTNGQAVFNHASATTTDRTYTVALIG